jgi:succinoglycan biosynthesis protein ExoA
MANTPFVTVIMPVRNEAAYISSAIRSVLAQDYPCDRMEILVADGMSNDGTRGIINSFSARNPNLHLVENRGRIVPTAMNAALARSKGEVIVRIDGHCEPATDYVSQCVRHLYEDDIDAIGGPIETIGNTFSAEVIALAMSSRFGVGGAAFRTFKGTAMLADTVAFPAYKRAAIEKLGPYDEELVRNQDDEYNYRLRKFGGKLLLSSDVRSRYYSRGSIRGLWRQYFQYGYWKVRVMQKHTAQMRLRQFVPPAFVLTLVLSALLAPLSNFALAALLVIVAAYIAANIAATLTTGGRRLRTWPLLSLAFSTLHMSYGCGFLCGLIAFRRRWFQNRPERSSEGWMLPHER